MILDMKTLVLYLEMSGDTIVRENDYNDSMFRIIELQIDERVRAYIRISDGYEYGIIYILFPLENKLYLNVYQDSRQKIICKGINCNGLYSFYNNKGNKRFYM